MCSARPTFAHCIAPVRALAAAADPPVNTDFANDFAGALALCLRGFTRERSD
jgi:hypothetical protein